MRRDTSTLGGLLAGGYLLLTLAAVVPLLQEGYVGHGNGPIFVLAVALTSPLSVMLLLINDRVSNANAFYETGWPYYITLFEVGAGALMNAAAIYMGVVFIQRWWRRRANPSPVSAK